MSIPTRNNFLETESFESLMKSLTKSLKGGAVSGSGPTAENLFDMAQVDFRLGNNKNGLEKIQQIRTMQNVPAELLEAANRFEQEVRIKLLPEQLRTNLQPLQPAPPQETGNIYNDLLNKQLEMLKKHKPQDNKPNPPNVGGGGSQGGGFNSLGSSSGGGGDENLTPQELFELAEADFGLSNNKDALAKLDKIRAIPNVNPQLLYSVSLLENTMVRNIPPQYLNQNFMPQNPNVNKVKPDPNDSNGGNPLLQYMFGNVGATAQFKPKKVAPVKEVKPVNPIVTTSLQLAKDAYVTATGANATAAQKQQAVDAAQRAVNAASEPTNNATQENISNASHQWSIAMLANKQQGGSNGNQTIYIDYTYNGTVDFIECTEKTTLTGIYYYIYKKLNLLPVATRPVLPTSPSQLHRAITSNNANLTLHNIFGFRLRYNGRDFVEGELRVDAGDINHIANKKTQIQNYDYDNLSYIFDFNPRGPNIVLEVVLNPLDDRNNQSVIHATLG